MKIVTIANVVKNNGIPRGAIQRFRAYLNQQDTSGHPHRHLSFQQRVRLYGDYLYHQDRDRFMMELRQWISQNKMGH